MGNMGAWFVCACCRGSKNRRQQYRYEVVYRHDENLHSGSDYLESLPRSRNFPHSLTAQTTTNRPYQEQLQYSPSRHPLVPHNSYTQSALRFPQYCNRPAYPVKDQYRRADTFYLGNVGPTSARNYTNGFNEKYVLNCTPNSKDSWRSVSHLPPSPVKQNHFLNRPFAVSNGVQSLWCSNSVPVLPISPHTNFPQAKDFNNSRDTSRDISLGSSANSSKPLISAGFPSRYSSAPRIRPSVPPKFQAYNHPSLNHPSWSSGAPKLSQRFASLDETPRSNNNNNNHFLNQKGSLTRDLRQYLSTRFQKGSVNHDLQNTIRDNVYLRTVPVTTRAPRPGEVHGIDYTFLSREEFQALQKSGSLLEAGIFEGNHYGTPKPPAQGGEIGRTTSQVVLSGAHPSSEGKRRRNRSNVEAMAANTVDNPSHVSHSTEGPIPYPQLDDSERESLNNSGELGPLPPNWEKAFTENGEPYFIDHVAGTSSWLDPRLARVQKRNAEECGEDELPFGWERIDDPQYGTYYIDHVNRKTQYENPVLMAKKQIEEPLSSLQDEVYDDRSATFPRPSTKKPMEGDSMPELMENGHYPIRRPYSRSAFTRNPTELKGDFLRTTLTKSSRGLGFTIVGGDDHEEEFLQIKSVVPNGPAWQDGKLRTGDVLVYVNDTCVLGYTHADVVNMFQHIDPGRAVYLEVCRGYPLPFDPNDPNTEIVTTVAVSSAADTHPSKPPFSTENLEDCSRNNSNESMNTAKSMPDLSNTERVQVPRPGSADLLNCENYDPSQGNHNTYPTSSTLNKTPEYFSIPIVKGNMGFGFTIADSVYGQKVKKILDRSRCKNLNEGDILIEINNINMRGMSHSEVVQILKDCTHGEESMVVVQRGGFGSLTKNKIWNRKDQSSSPKKPASSNSASVNGSGGLFRSKTPTADMYSSQPKEVIPNRPKTPLVDTRNRSKTPNYFERNNVDSNERHYSNTNPPCPGAFSYLGSNSIDRITDPKISNLASQLSHSNLLNGNSFENGSDKYPQEYSSYPNEHSQGQGYYANNNYQRDMYPQNGFQTPHYSYEYSKETYEKYLEPSTNSYSQYSYYPGTLSNGHPYNDYSNSNQNPNFNHSNGYGYVPYSKEGFDVPRQDSGYSSQAQIPPSRNPYSYCNQNGSLGYSGTPDGYYLPPDLARRKESTSFELEHPASVPVPRLSSSGNTSSLSRYGIPNSKDNTNPPYREFSVVLRRQETGFGFRIVGGTEEGSQVSVGHIVPGGSADRDGLLVTGDEIIRVDGEAVLGASHHTVVHLMAAAAERSRVALTLRRAVNPHHASSGSGVAHDAHNRSIEMSGQLYPYDVTVDRRENEGFGFVIISSVTKSGSTIGRIIEGSPAERCERLHVGDRILRVNGIDIKSLHHGSIVNLIKESGYSVTLTIGPPRDDASSTASTSQRAESEMGDDGGAGAEVLHVDLHRSSRGFGFSIRGGREFHHMPLFVLRIAENGPAAMDDKLKVGDQLLEINRVSTKGMTHAEAIELIKQCGSSVSLLVRRGGKLPPYMDPLNPMNANNLGSPVGPPPPGTHIRSTATLPSGSPSAFGGPLGGAHFPGYSSVPQNMPATAGSSYPSHPGSGIPRMPAQPFHSSPANQYSNGPLGQSSPRVPIVPGNSTDNYYWNRPA